MLDAFYKLHCWLLRHTYHASAGPNDKFAITIECDDDSDVHRLTQAIWQEEKLTQVMPYGDMPTPKIIDGRYQLHFHLFSMDVTIRSKLLHPTRNQHHHFRPFP